MRTLIIIVALFATFTASANNNAAVSMIVKTLILDEPHNFVKNGHFEFGDLSGWTTNLHTEPFNARAYKDGNNTVAGFADFNGGGRMGQFIALPKAFKRRAVTLSFDLKRVLGPINVEIRGDKIALTRRLFDVDAGNKVSLSFDVDQFTNDVRITFINSGEGQGVLTIDNVSLVVE